MKVPEIFGSLVFNDSVMRDRLPKETYVALKRTIERNDTLDLSVATIVANAMKDWAIEKEATHYTHWFQPMTGVTAEKHDSFISSTGNGKIIMEFSGKELIKGEPDASSFPSGGLRSTFEARGYTAWDPTSYAFIKDGTLCIPTVFCSYGGHILDKKTPLLRSTQVINTQALRILKIFRTKAKRVIPTVGAEQEYFLVDKDLYNKRKDLVYCGRTLFGARPPKGQELDDHYFGAIKTRVSAYMKELDETLWRYGILAKTKHNESAPAQHELAPIFDNCNLATDHNQLTMEIMKKIAEKHNLVCLLHEKPFAGVNGSGKHNNWSLSTDSGANLLEPGISPKDNAQFLLFVSAVIRAVDIYQDILRVSVTSAGNDHRLGGNEAPPAIISMFLGDELTGILEAISKGTCYKEHNMADMEIGVQCLPRLPKDNTDRNRTSPFAFTGNKFEFRMLGSSASIACTNTILNTIVAESLDFFATELENCSDVNTTLNSLIKENYLLHKRIVFNGNNYSEEWKKEASKRGLSNLISTATALPTYSSEKSISLFDKYKIYSKEEVTARMEILQANYSKTINIEAHTALEMVRKQIIPAVSLYCKELATAVFYKKEINVSYDAEMKVLEHLSLNNSALLEKSEQLEKLLSEVKGINNLEENTKFFNDNVCSIMNEIRTIADKMETYTARTYWPFPTYGDLMFCI
ncbi:MAG TPA: glutamine synthetase III [Clostridia bacterium]|nr:glutamine synthetase III [Clostridia bacterium]